MPAQVEHLSVDLDKKIFVSALQIFEILPDKLVLVASLGNLFSDDPSAPGRLDHVLLQLVDVLGVLLEGVADGCLEVVDGDKVGEEGEDVLNLDGWTLLQELHRQFDVVLLLDHMLSYLNHILQLSTKMVEEGDL